MNSLPSNRRLFRSIGSTLTALLVGALAIAAIPPAAYTAETPAIQVDGEQISQQQFDQQVERMIQRMKRVQAMRKRRGGGKGGGPQPSMPSDEELRKRAQTHVQDRMVRKLLLQTHAKNSGITVSDEQVEEKWNELQKQFDSEEKFLQAIEKRGLSETRLRRDIRNTLKIQKLLEQETGELSVTDTEARAFYNQNKKRMGGKSFADVKGKIITMMEKRKGQQAAEKLVSKLRDKYEVTVNVGS